ncbi:MAG: hypothetical protein ACI9EF_003540 [Pseudohongiellaceae bacterium]|jgi:hypothetical protein
MGCDLILLEGFLLPSRRVARHLFGIPTRLLLLFLCYLVVVDVFLTQNWLQRGIGREVNPLISWLINEGGVLLFVSIKVGLTALCVLWIARRAPEAAARAATLVGFSIYVPVTGLHVMNAFGVGMA